MSGCCDPVIDGQAGAGTPNVAQVSDIVLVDIDFRELANNVFADGNETIDGVVWVAANTANSNTWEIQNGTGLRFNAAAVNSTYDNAVRTAPNLSVPLLTLIPGFDPLRTYVMDFFLSSVTFGASPNRFIAGLLLDTGGTDRLLAGGRRNSAGNQQTCSQVDATIAGDAATDDAFGVRLSGNGVLTFSGTYDGANDEFPIYTHAGGVEGITNSFNGPFDPTQSRVVLAWPTGEVGGNMDCTLARFRVRRIVA